MIILQNAALIFGAMAVSAAACAQQAAGRDKNPRTWLHDRLPPVLIDRDGAALPPPPGSRSVGTVINS